eukprot:2559853-Rhodomonas_salina.4
MLPPVCTSGIVLWASTSMRMRSGATARNEPLSLSSRAIAMRCPVLTVFSAGGARALAKRTTSWLRARAETDSWTAERSVTQVSPSQHSASAYPPTRDIGHQRPAKQAPASVDRIRGLALPSQAEGYDIAMQTLTSGMMEPTPEGMCTHLPWTSSNMEFSFVPALDQDTSCNCQSDCTCAPVAGPVCGNGVVELGEVRLPKPSSLCAGPPSPPRAAAEAAAAPPPEAAAAAASP